MYLTEAEILDTPQALAMTCKYFSDNEIRIDAFFEKHTQRKFTILGCGSSYMLAESVAVQFAALPDTVARAIPAGDYVVDPDFWQGTVKDSIVITLSRSGQTSEMVWAVEQIRQRLACPVISISAKADNEISPICDLDLVLPWCYDESVCQTRTVTNFYAAALLLQARYAGDGAISKGVQDTCGMIGRFHLKNRPMLEKIAALDWDNAVVLADGPVCGLAAEGALAFTEIAMLTGRYFHLLDYRHGPIVISGKKTLTLILLRPGEEKLQNALVRDVIRRGGPVVTVSDQPGNPYGSTVHIQVEGVRNYAAWGIPFIYTAQMTALLKALDWGGNPDAPEGLDAFIALK